MHEDLALSPAHRSLILLSVAVLGASACAGVWEVLASQAPSSPLYLGTLPGPIRLARESALHLGLCLLAFATLVPRAERHGSALRVVLALHVGVALALGALCYGALQGMYGAQLFDLRADATPLFLAKHTGFGVVAAGLYRLARRALAT